MIGGRNGLVLKSDLGWRVGEERIWEYARVMVILAGIPHDIWGGLGTSAAVPYNVV